MTITFVSKSDGTPTSALTNKSTVTKPTGLAVDDVMIAYTASNLNGMTAPAGWTQILSRDSNQGNLFRVRVFYKVATSSDVAASSFVFNDSDSSSPAWASVSAYRGVDTANPIDASDSTPNSGSSASHTTPSVTTTHSSMILSHNACRRNSTSSVTFTSGVAHERFQGGNHDAVGYWAAMYDSGTETDPGTISGVSITASTTSSVTDSILTTVALKTLNVAVNASAGVATATVNTKTPTMELTASPAPDVAPATVSTKTPAGGVGAVGGKADAAVSVKQVDIFTTPFSNAPAGCAQVAVSAKQTQMDYAPAGKASVAVLARDVSESIGNRADVVTATTAAYEPTLGFGVSTGVAQPTASGKSIAVGLGLNVGLAQVNASAYVGILYFGSSRMIDVGEEIRTIDVAWEERTLMVEES